MKYFIIVLFLVSCGSAPYRQPNIILSNSINKLDESVKKQGLWETKLSDIIKYRKITDQNNYTCLVPYRNDRVVFDLGFDFTYHSNQILHLSILLSYIVCAVFLYLIFSRLAFPPWYGLIIAVALTFMSPQTERIFGHLGLALFACYLPPG